MAACRSKIVKQAKNPAERPDAKNTQSPETFNNMRPSWRFSSCDTEAWTFSAKQFMQIILPRLKEWEALTWNEILIHSKKENHSIDAQMLNKTAQARLDELRIETKAVISLRMKGTYRLYGYRIGNVFYILWFDTNHGDNDTCVCRSRKKHT